MRRTWKILAVVLGLVALSELGFRVLEGRLQLAKRVQDGRAFLLHGTSPDYAPEAHMVFRRPPSVRGFNSLGFRGPEWPREKQPGVARILCLGSSTTENFNQDAYPPQLERILEQRTGRDFEVLVAAVAGWTTAEELVAWFLTLQDYEPDLLLFHCGINDVMPRFRADFVPDYSHWRRSFTGGTSNPFVRFLASWSDLFVVLDVLHTPDVMNLTSTPQIRMDPLAARGELRHETSLPFRRNVQSIAASARARGATVALMTMPLKKDYEGPGGKAWLYGVAEHNQHLRELCAENGYLLVDSERAFEQRPELQSEFKDICHLGAAGNRAKAEQAAEVLLASWVPLVFPAAPASAPESDGR